MDKCPNLSPRPLKELLKSMHNREKTAAFKTEQHKSAHSSLKEI